MNVLPLSIATCVTLFASCPAQANVLPQSTPGSGSEPAANRNAGLPTFLLEVPGGTVELGLSAQQLFEAACQSALPFRPAQAVKSAGPKVELAMKRSVSLLGPQKVPVEPFLLGKWPVKASEYEVFVALSRQPGTQLEPVLPPFGWWRYGRKDDYDKRLAEINQMFPKNSEGPLLYWQQKGHELPYKLEDADGKSIADHPVGYISYTEANRFAAWLGMRLPFEAEWTRAARGDGNNVWPWGVEQDDKFVGQKSLEALRLYAAADKKPKPAGTVAAAAGPYGHVDMFGSIWQLTSGLGFYPINGTDPFAAEWKALQKDKEARDILKAPPMWKDVGIVTKGGSYLSGDDPIQLMVDQRAPVGMDDVLESVGFRLAKSLRPGYDTLYSLLRGVYNRTPFAPDQAPVLADQVGAERYELGPNGFPTAYFTVSFAPTNWLEKGKSADLKKLFEESHRRPLVLGSLVLTEKIQGIDTKGEIFTVLYRAEGMPRELESAIKEGYREVQAQLKAAEKAKKAGLEPKEEEADDKKKAKADDWQEVLKRYGLTPKDLEDKEAKNGLDFVRIDGVVVKTDRAAFLLHGNEGKVVGAIPAPNARPSASQAFPAEIELVDDGNGKALAKFHFGVPFVDASDRRVVDFSFFLPLECPAPTADKPWRLPEPKTK